MVPTPKNSALLSYSANSTSEIVRIFSRTINLKVNYVLSYLKGTALDCFKSAILDPDKPDGLLISNWLPANLLSNFGTMTQSAKQEAELERTLHA